MPVIRRALALHKNYTEPQNTATTIHLDTSLIKVSHLLAGV